MNSENHDLCKSAGFNLGSPGVCRFFFDQDNQSNFFVKDAFFGGWQLGVYMIWLDNPPPTFIPPQLCQFLDGSHL